MGTDDSDGSAMRRARPSGAAEPAADTRAEAPGTAKPRRRKKKPAGSKWLNRLLALGCCASLVPLCIEFYWTMRPDHMAKPKKDDPWVRVIDAAPPEDALAKGSVTKRFRHHPRHARVRADGTTVDADAVESDAEEDAPVGYADAMEGERRGAARAAALLQQQMQQQQMQQQKEQQQQQQQQPEATNASSASGASGASNSSRSQQPAAELRAAKVSATASSNGTSLDDDDLVHFFRQVDRQVEQARAGRVPINASSSNATGTGPRMHRIWRTVPGGVHDIIEGEGDNRTVFSVEGMQAPNVFNGSYVADSTGVLDAQTLLYLNRNLTWVDRLTPFRVLCVVVPRLPRDLSARHSFALQILRSWYGSTRMFERTALVVLSRDGLVEITVGKQAKLVFSDAVAHHFAFRAMEMLAHHNASIAEPPPALLQETAQKLIFYISFTVRSRTQATAVSMRSMSMFMMMFMMMTITATKQQQARRYAELYGYDPYSRRAMMYGQQRDDFWDEFETGRRGGVDRLLLERHEQEQAFFRLQLLSMILSQRAQHGEDDDDDDEGEEEYEEEELLLMQQQAFYEDERGACESSGAHR